MNILKAAALAFLLSAGSAALAADATVVTALNSDHWTLLATSQDVLVTGQGGVALSTYATGTQPSGVPLGAGFSLTNSDAPVEIDLASGDSLYAACTTPVCSVVTLPVK